MVTMSSSSISLVRSGATLLLSLMSRCKPRRTILKPINSSHASWRVGFDEVEMDEITLAPAAKMPVNASLMVSVLLVVEFARSSAL